MPGLRRISPPRVPLVERAAPHDRAGALLIRGLRRAAAWLPVLLLALAALLPRAAGLADFYTTDEAYFWQGRVARFGAALSMADWPATNQTGHPGVTTMWLGSLGQRFSGAPGAQSPEPGAGASYLAALRLPLAVANALAVVAGYLLLRRLLPSCAALLAGLLWATSPFLIAHGRLLHLDALLASLMTLSLLCLLVATRPGGGSEGEGGTPLGRRLALAAAGLLAGLALLTKAPALLLIPVSAATLLAAELWGRGWGRPALLAGVARAGLGFALWLAAATLVFVALWPAMWVSPGAALGAVAEEILGNGAQPHNAGNFFMGQPVADPGWSFYGLVVLWRGEVLMLIGLAALWLLWAQRFVRLRRSLSPPASAVAEPAERWAAYILAGFAILFTLALTLLAKKFDRYLLPIWPALQILAAVGLAGLLAQVGAAVKGLRPGAQRAASALVAAALATAMLLPPLIYRPYYLAYYNPLLGGGTTAQAVLLSGWGEGMEQAGAWLSARPDFRRGPVLSWLPLTLAPFIPADVAVYDLDLESVAEPANYAVVYRSVAERDSQAVAEAYALQTPPLHTVRVGGLTYMTIHQLPRPFEQVVGAVFSGVHLRGFSQSREGPRLVITPSWDVQVAQPGAVFSFVHVLDAGGRRVAQIDALIDDGMFDAWQVGQQFGTPLPITLPPDLPPGKYRVVLGLYRADGQRLPLSHGEPLPAELAGPDAIELFAIELGDTLTAMAR